MDYNFSQKRHWRRSLWNCISDRIPVKPSQALVLYLAGAKDEDRAIALQKGFSQHNLIAIERDEQSAAELKRRGVLTLVGDAFEHVHAWRPDRHIDVLVLDLCCGLTGPVSDAVLDMLTHPHLQGSVIAINLLRGRDQSGNEVRDIAGRLMSKSIEGDKFEAMAARLGIVPTDELRQRVANVLMSSGSKNRAEVLLATIRWWWSGMVGTAMGIWEQQSNGAFHRVREPTNKEQIEVYARLGRIVSGSRSQVLTYRSVKHQTFDTLIFINSLGAGAVLTDDKAAHLDARPGSAEIRRKHAAVLAHRTRRMAA